MSVHPEQAVVRPAQPRVSSGAVFFDENERLLLVKPTYKAGWNLPGGGVDEGETPREACVREVREELGLEPPIGSLLLVVWATLASGAQKAFFVFDGGHLDVRQRSAIILDPRELSEHVFVPVDEASTLVPAWQAPLVTELTRARAHGATRYLEIVQSG